MYKIAS